MDNRELDIDLTFITDLEGHLVGAAIYGSEAETWIDFQTLIINQTYMSVSTLITILSA